MVEVREQLALAGVEVDFTSLRITDPDLPFEQYARVARLAGQFKAATSFWLGDLVNFGDRLYGDKYVEAMEATGLRYETLSNYAMVCRKVARSRRRDLLRFGHHAEVASLEPHLQTEWLGAAEANGWSRNELRDALRASRNSAPEPEEPAWTSARPEVVTPATPEEAAEAADRAGQILDRPLPEGHALWRTQAEQAARDVLSLARAVVEHPPVKQAAIRVMEAAVVDGDGYRVPREPLDALLEKVLKEPDGEEEG
jgi:hypothetical protein